MKFSHPEYTGKVRGVFLKPETPGERGLPKHAQTEVFVTFMGVQNDFNRYRHEKKNDNPYQAILVMPYEWIERLRKFGWPVEPGHLGENICIDDIPARAFRKGSHLYFHEAHLELTKPAKPCNNLSVLPYVGQEKVREFIRILYGYRGWYARVLHEGRIVPGEQVTLR